MTTIGQVDTVALKRFIAIDKELDELDKQAKKLKAEAAGIEPALRMQFEQAGQQSANMDGKTVYISGTIRCSAVKDEVTGTPDWARASAGLIAAGYAQYVTEKFDLNSVGALVREFPVDELTLMPVLPEPLRDVLILRNDVKLKVVASRGRGARSSASVTDDAVETP